jgi:hypothetical protein
MIDLPVIRVDNLEPLPGLPTLHFVTRMLGLGLEGWITWGKPGSLALINYRATVVSTHSERLRFAPKVPVAWIVHLYCRGALQLQDDELEDKVSERLYARSLDIVMVSDGRLACPACQTEFALPHYRIYEETRHLCRNDPASGTCRHGTK